MFAAHPGINPGQGSDDSLSSVLLANFNQLADGSLTTTKDELNETESIVFLTNEVPKQNKEKFSPESENEEKFTGFIAMEKNQPILIVYSKVQNMISNQSLETSINGTLSSQDITRKTDECKQDLICHHSYRKQTRIGKLKNAINKRVKSRSSSTFPSSKSPELGNDSVHTLHQDPVIFYDVTDLVSDDQDISEVTPTHLGARAALNTAVRALLPHT